MRKISSVPALPPRGRDGHKGLYGRVLVVGGQDDMIGAPVLAATAALRMGAGLVQIAVPKAILPTCLSITPELVGLGLGKTKSDEALDEAAAKADAIVVGPGMGRSADAARRLKQLVQIAKPMVIDADALNVFAEGKKWPGEFAAKAVLTPHPGEMARLGKLCGVPDVPDDDQGRIHVSTVAAKAFKQVVVLKGDRTVVNDGQRVFVNMTGDSSLSKAGAGDVLCGMIATLLAQRLSLFDAACLGVNLHGRAGEIAGEKMGRRSVMAREVIHAIYRALAEHERKKHG